MLLAVVEGWMEEQDARGRRLGEQVEEHEQGRRLLAQQARRPASSFSSAPWSWSWLWCCLRDRQTDRQNRETERGSEKGRVCDRCVSGAVLVWRMQRGAKECKRADVCLTGEVRGQLAECTEAMSAYLEKEGAVLDELGLLPGQSLAPSSFVIALSSPRHVCVVLPASKRGSRR